MLKIKTLFFVLILLGFTSASSTGDPASFSIGREFLCTEDLADALIDSTLRMLRFSVVHFVNKDILLSYIRSSSNKERFKGELVKLLNERNMCNDIQNAGFSISYKDINSLFYDVLVKLGFNSSDVRTELTGCASPSTQMFRSANATRKPVLLS